MMAANHIPPWDSRFSVCPSKNNTQVHPRYKHFFEPVEPDSTALRVRPSHSPVRTGFGTDRMDIEAERHKSPTQREQESSWNSRFCVSRSKDNTRLPVYARDFFDSPKLLDTDLPRETNESETSQTSKPHTTRYALPPLKLSKTKQKDNFTSPREIQRELGWDNSFSVLSSKDNPFVHPRFREFFDTPRSPRIGLHTARSPITQPTKSPRPPTNRSDRAYKRFHTPHSNKGIVLQSLVFKSTPNKAFDEGQSTPTISPLQAQEMGIAA